MRDTVTLAPPPPLLTTVAPRCRSQEEFDGKTFSLKAKISCEDKRVLLSHKQKTFRVFVVSVISIVDLFDKYELINVFVYHLDYFKVFSMTRSTQKNLKKIS